MAYEPTMWSCGDDITVEALNKLEQGLAVATQGNACCEEVVRIIDGTITSISNDRVSKVGSNLFALCDSLETVAFPNATEIGRYAFRNCYSLSVAIIPNAETISDCAFQNCSNLTSVSMTAVRTIEMEAFAGCDMYEVTLPNVEYISRRAFANCSNLSTLYILASQVASAHTSAFRDTELEQFGGSIYVPASLVSAYQTSPTWSNFSQYIFAYSE